MLGHPERQRSRSIKTSVYVAGNGLTSLFLLFEVELDHRLSCWLLKDEQIHAEEASRAFAITDQVG